jgi:four helix bundle protein
MGSERRPHHNLEAWKSSMSLVTFVYKISRSFPKEEIYGLTSQMRRAAVSVPSNLAEGAARSGQREFAQFLSIALETQLLIAVELEYMEQGHAIFDLLDKVSRLLTGLHKKVTA